MFPRALRWSRLSRPWAVGRAAPGAGRRAASHMIPPTQYDIPLPKRLFLSSMLAQHWEVWPLVMVTVVDMAILAASIIWASLNKVDVARKQGRNISRTMNLREPTSHKLLVLHQRTRAWPELQYSLDRMRDMELKLQGNAALPCGG